MQNLRRHHHRQRFDALAVVNSEILQSCNYASCMYAASSMPPAYSARRSRVRARARSPLARGIAAGT